MATDQSKPRMNVIAPLALVTIVTLIALRFVLQSYYSLMLDGEEERKILGVEPAMLHSLRQDEARRLESAPMTIDRAMDTLAHGRPAAIAPQPSTDIAAMQGWTQRPRVFVPGTTQTQQSTTPQPAPAPTPAGTVGGPTTTNAPGSAGPIGAPGALPANGPSTPPAQAPAQNQAQPAGSQH